MRTTRSILLTVLSLFVLSTVVHAGSNEFGLDPSNIDDTCHPCQDFYQWANGGWLATNEIPTVYSSWSVWHEIHERNLETLRELLNESAEHAKTGGGGAIQQVGDFYSTAMDTNKIEDDGIAPLTPFLREIDEMQNGEDLQRVIGKFHRYGLDFGFSTWVDQDLKRNTQIIVYAQQGGIGLPERDYYTREDEESQEIRDEYVAHIARMLVLTGRSELQAQADAKTILDMETRLAKVSLTAVEMRDPETYYNMVSVKEADALTPNFSWVRYYNSMGLGDMSEFSYAHPKFFEEFNKMLADRSLDDWKSYLRWHLVNSSANYLSSDFVDEHFAFFGTTLNGTEELQPRWKRVLYSTNAVLGEVLGQVFVQKKFPPEAKKQALDMISNIQSALETRINGLDWMSDVTKQQALEKLSTFTGKIGYPDKWRDYSSYEVKRDSYINNMLRGWAFEFERNVNKIGKPVDKTEWGMNPQTVNAYYNPLLNEIVFPAAIMQPPFFDPNIDIAVNYGAMGAVIGHEITHGFDDEGSKFDAEGNLKSWWTEADRAEFEKRTEVMVDLYDGFVAVDNLNVNGELTLGENIADLGGMSIAYDGLQLALKGKPKTKIDGFTPEQRFFMSWAQTWRTLNRAEALKVQVQTDPHSPGKWRTNGPLQNMQSFAKAFECKEGDPMVLPKDTRVDIW